MTRREIKTWATYLIFLTRPHPYMVSLLLIILLQAISFVSMQTGGQPFVMDMSAAAAGDTVNMIRFIPENITVKTTLILLVLELASVLIRYGYQSYCLHVARLQKSSYYDLMDGFMVAFRAVVIWVIVAVAVYIGLLLFLVPGLIVSYAYTMAPRLLLDHPDWGPLRCLTESRRLMRGRKKDYFQLQLSLIGWKILRVFPMAAVFAEPYVTVCNTLFYMNITGDKNLERVPSEDNKKPPWEY